MNLKKQTKGITSDALKKVAVTAVVISLSLAFPLAASASAGHGHSEALPSILDFIISKKIYWINFIAYTALISFAVSKAFPKGWKSRRDIYMQALNLGKQKLAESELKLSEARAFHETLPQKIATIKSNLEAEAKIESARLVKEATDKAKQITLSGQEGIEAERRMNDQKFKSELINLAVSKAYTKATESAATSDVESRLRSRVVDKVSSLVN